MSALPGREQKDVGVVNYGRVVQWCEGDKRIVLGMDYQSRYADLINDRRLFAVISMSGSRDLLAM